jgi:hypothetical protein
MRIAEGQRTIPNTFAYVALFGWPGVCLALFILLPLETAAIGSLLGAYLLLPSNFTVDPPLLPPIDKMGIAALATFLLCLMKAPPARRARPSVLVYLLCAAFVVSPFLTTFGNSYELQITGGSIPGFYPLDGLKLAGRHVLELLPFFIGSRYLSSDRGRELLLKSLVIALMFYSLPMLFEIRMSPQLHYWVYGYYPSQFVQQMRAGGFRPVVFTQHGLALAMFTSLCVIAAVVLIRAKRRVLHMPASLSASYLAAILLLCKSLGPAIYATLLTPVVLLTKPRTWVKLSLVLVLIVTTYPALRNSGLIPLHSIATAAESVSADRSQSLEFRLNNEEKLLAKADEKPWFGWGTWGRNRVYDRSGKDVSVTDGGWIIQFGTFGWFGYLSLFGLLLTAVCRAYRGIGHAVTPATITCGGLVLLLGVYVVDQVPNGNPMTLVLLLAGTVSSSAIVRARHSAFRRPARIASPSPVPTA